jgi:hypothetical protein
MVNHVKPKRKGPIVKLREIETRVANVHARATRELASLTHVPRRRPHASVLVTCELDCPACAAETRYNAELRPLNAEELEVRALLASSARKAAVQLETVRHKGQRRISDEAIKRELRKGGLVKEIAARLGVSTRTVNHYRKVFGEHLI